MHTIGHGDEAQETGGFCLLRLEDYTVFVFLQVTGVLNAVLGALLLGFLPPYLLVENISYIYSATPSSTVQLPLCKVGIEPTPDLSHVHRFALTDKPMAPEEQPKQQALQVQPSRLVEGLDLLPLSYASCGFARWPDVDKRPRLLPSSSRAEKSQVSLHRTVPCLTAQSHIGTKGQSW